MTFTTGAFVGLEKLGWVHHVFKIVFPLTWSISLMRSLATSTATLTSLARSGELLSLSIIFSHTATLAGWGPGELIALLGVFRLVNALMAALIWPKVESKSDWRNTPKSS
mgnify:CR=1 FL=1